MPKSKISKPEVKQPRVVLRSSVAEILSAYDKQIYSVEQAAQMLGVSRPTFFRRLKAWRETGQIPLHGNNGHAPPLMKRANGLLASYEPNIMTSKPHF